MEKKIPKLRFPEFEGEWVEKKLGEISENIMYGMNSAAIEFDGNNKYLRITDIDESSRTYIPNPITSPNGKIDIKYKLKDNDLVFARTGASVGKSYLYNRKDGNLFFAGFLIRFSITYGNPYFVYTQTLRDNYDKWVQLMSMRSGQPGINAEEYKTFSFKSPTLPEQTKIANFLSAVDDKITQLKKKKELLEQYKKGVMQKIFSQELRFKDENGEDFAEWEEKKVKDIFEITRGYVLSMTMVNENQDEKNCYPVYSSQTRNKGLAGYYDKFLYKDCITWTTDGAGAGDVNFRKGKFYCTNVCGVLKSDKGYANKFIAELLNSISKKYVSYVGNPKLMNNAMSEISIIIPSCVSEQTKIANFLSAIDDKINHCGIQIEKMEAWKKGLLQQMFV